MKGDEEAHGSIDKEILKQAQRVHQGRRVRIDFPQPGTLGYAWPLPGEQAWIVQPDKAAGDSAAFVIAESQIHFIKTRSRKGR